MPTARARRDRRRLRAARRRARSCSTPAPTAPSVVARLVALRRASGRGPASYVAMRALGDPDVFLPTDLGVRHALDALGVDARPGPAARLAERWSPWRSYALHHLWASLCNDHVCTPHDDRLAGASSVRARRQRARPARRAVGATTRPERVPFDDAPIAASATDVLDAAADAARRVLRRRRAPRSTSRSTRSARRSSRPRGRCCARSRTARRSPTASRPGASATSRPAAPSARRTAATR